MSEKLKNPAIGAHEREENPFEDPAVAEEWIRTVEGERGMIRDKEIYPAIDAWASRIGDGLIVEIGAGQGICSEHLGSFQGRYLGIEPSEKLVERGAELYQGKENVHFVVGTAYELPIADNSADGIFSVNVWFHLADLPTASAELAQKLKTGGTFTIITANPRSYEAWESFYDEPAREGNKIVGKVNLPVNSLSKNTMYQHTLGDILSALESNGLTIGSQEDIGAISKYPGQPLFINISGKKGDG